MDSRPKLQEDLQTAVGSSVKVYFEPPVSTKITYPCVVFSLGDRVSVHANNKRYINRDVYTITLIDRSYISGIETCEKLENTFDNCNFDRHYVADGLHHYVYTITILRRTNHV